MIKAPIKYFGGKGTMLNKLFKYFPEPSSYNIFVDAYAGSAVVALNIDAEIKIINDLDDNVYSLFNTIAHEDSFAKFKRLCEISLYNERSCREYKRSLREDELPEWLRAYRFWYVNRSSHNGIGGFSINTVVRRRMSKSTSDFLSSVEGLQELHEALSSCIVTSRNALDCIRFWDRKNVFIYCDPPYHQSTRTSARYNVDADNDHHEQLVEVLNNLQHAQVALSGYDCELYQKRLKLNKYEFEVNTTTGNHEPKTKVECIWTNFKKTDSIPTSLDPSCTPIKFVIRQI